MATLSFFIHISFIIFLEKQRYYITIFCHWTAKSYRTSSLSRELICSDFAKVSVYERFYKAYRKQSFSYVTVHWMKRKLCATVRTCTSSRINHFRIFPRSHDEQQCSIKRKFAFSLRTTYAFDTSNQILLYVWSCNNFEALI